VRIDADEAVAIDVGSARSLGRIGDVQDQHHVELIGPATRGERAAVDAGLMQVVAQLAARRRGRHRDAHLRCPCAGYAARQGAG
jgi:hypothetical protein